MNRMIIKTPIGNIELIEDTGYLKRVSFEENLHEEIDIIETDFLKNCATQILEYFKGERKSFDIPIMLTGTNFQLSVWKALMEIPFGEIKTYQQIAERIGNKKGYRAVGLANYNNPLPVIIPCHRVLGKNGRLTGYIGGLNRKEKLIALERNHE